MVAGLKRRTWIGSYRLCSSRSGRGIACGIVVLSLSIFFVGDAQSVVVSAGAINTTHERSHLVFLGSLGRQAVCRTTIIPNTTDNYIQ